MISVTLLALLVTASLRLRQAIANHPARRRAALIRHYQEDTEPRVPRQPRTELELGLLLYQLANSMNHGTLGTVAGAPVGTKALFAAFCLPFCKPGGFAAPLYALQPFTVWELRDFYRLFTSVFLHSDIVHLINNLASLTLTIKGQPACSEGVA